MALVEIKLLAIIVELDRANSAEVVADSRPGSGKLLAGLIKAKSMARS